LIQIDDLYSYDIKNNRLLKDGKSVDLSTIEINLVSYLVENKGYYVSLDSLQNVVWEGRDITYSDIRMCVKRVRQKCDKDLIKNKKLVGYKIG